MSALESDRIIIVCEDHLKQVWIIMQNLILKCEQLKCNSNIYKTKEIIRQEAVLENLLNICEHEMLRIANATSGGAPKAAWANLLEQ